jgi:hypothetical protein
MSDALDTLSSSCWALFAPSRRVPPPDEEESQVTVWSGNHGWNVALTFAVVDLKKINIFHFLSFRWLTKETGQRDSSHSRIYHFTQHNVDPHHMNDRIFHPISIKIADLDGILRPKRTGGSHRRPFSARSPARLAEPV